MSGRALVGMENGNRGQSFRWRVPPGESLVAFCILRAPLRSTPGLEIAQGSGSPMRIPGPPSLPSAYLTFHADFLTGYRQNGDLKIDKTRCPFAFGVKRLVLELFAVRRTCTSSGRRSRISVLAAPPVSGGLTVGSGGARRQKRATWLASFPNPPRPRRRLRFSGSNCKTGLAVERSAFGVGVGLKLPRALPSISPRFAPASEEQSGHGTPNAARRRPWHHPVSGHGFNLVCRLSSGGSYRRRRARARSWSSR